MEAAGQRLLDFSQPFDVALLDQVVTTFHSGGPERNMANKVLMALQENPMSWTRVDVILEQSQNPNSRFLGLQILEETVLYRWKALPKEQSEGIKNYIVNKIIALSQDEATMAAHKVFLGKMNLVLVHILKQEWPHNWPSFVPDLVGASKTSEVLCENNMAILKLLSEEVFEFSKDQMTTDKIKTMKEGLTHEFQQIFELCDYILERSQKPQLLLVTLQTLLRFLQWIPLRFVFETNMIEQLLTKFLPRIEFRNDTIRCLTEVGSLSVTGAQYDTIFQKMYAHLMGQLATALPPETNIAAAFEAGTERDEHFVQALALFFAGFFKQHLSLLEVPEYQHALLQGMSYLVEISKVDDDQIFKICLEYWHHLTNQLYQQECQFSQGAAAASSPLMLGGAGGGAGAQMAHARKVAYRPVFSRVRQVMIAKMVKPEEVLIVEDENGEIVREQQKDTEALSQYKTMRETLVYLTHLDYEDTETLMLEKLALQVDGSEWSWNNLNTLCWAIGSISGAMNEEEEKRFLVTVIKDLLGLCEMKRGKDNKAVIASNIMYVVGQYPRFLRAHWKFLKTVVNKLFEFMHELHPGVQDMACDTFLKIAQKCKRKFVTVQVGERMTFIEEELLGGLPSIVSDLESHQIHTFYEAVGCMLSAHPDAAERDRLLASLMALPNGSWRDIMNNASVKMESLMCQDTIREVIKILKTNSCCCQSVGAGFISQLGTIYLDMLNVYKAYSEHISNAIAAQGPMATRTTEIRAMRAAKKDVLRLIEVFITKCDDPKVVAANFIPPLLDPVLGDYQRNIPDAREPEVLSLMAGVVTGLKMVVVGEVPRIFEAVFECTLQMITHNFEDFPEHRIKFFMLIKAVNLHCFQALFAIPPEHQKYVVDSVVWALKHTERNIADTGLEILLRLLQNVDQAPAVAQGFYQAYLLSLLQDILAVLTDRLHKPGFKMHASILQHIFGIVNTGKVTAPLWEGRADVTPTPGLNNQQFLHGHMCNMLCSSFGNVQRDVVGKFVTDCFTTTATYNKDPATDLAALKHFKELVRDFLVQLKEFSAEDNKDLYAEEAAAAQQQAAEAERARALQVPGLVNPHQLPDDDDL